jgi:hypothetical protein
MDRKLFIALVIAFTLSYNHVCGLLDTSSINNTHRPKLFIKFTLSNNHVLGELDSSSINDRTLGMMIAHIDKPQ